METLPEPISSAVTSPSPIRIGILGLGTVGSAAYQMLQENREQLLSRIGAPIEIVKIGVRDLAKKRSVDCGPLTTDLFSIVDDPSIQVILELMGGISPAGELVERALNKGKHVVTANKELLAKHGSRLIRLAASHGLDLHFEAAVGGGIPLIQPLKHQLAGNDAQKLMGILNGTTNYILSKMTDEGLELGEVLAQAQAAGYAESDPTNDVEGFDAQFKLAILSSIAFGTEVTPEQVYREGISGVSRRDIQLADVLGYRIKLIGTVEVDSAGALLARVHPTLIGKSHPLASVNDVYNAVWFKGDFVGDVMFLGRGAGGHPTGSAVVGDLIDVCRNIQLGGAGHHTMYGPAKKMLPIESLETRFYLRMVVMDKPKVLGMIASVLGNCDVSLAAMEMRTLPGGHGELAFLTHIALERDFRRSLAALKNLHVVERIENWIRVQD